MLLDPKDAFGYPKDALGYPKKAFVCYKGKSRIILDIPERYSKRSDYFIEAHELEIQQSAWIFGRFIEDTSFRRSKVQPRIRVKSVYLALKTLRLTGIVFDSRDL
jgi:hypothetical protein